MWVRARWLPRVKPRGGREEGSDGGKEDGKFERPVETDLGYGTQVALADESHSLGVEPGGGVRYLGTDWLDCAVW